MQLAQPRLVAKLRVLQEALELLVKVLVAPGAGQLQVVGVGCFLGVGQVVAAPQRQQLELGERPGHVPEGLARVQGFEIHLAHVVFQAVLVVQGLVVNQVVGRLAHKIQHGQRTHHLNKMRVVLLLAAALVVGQLAGALVAQVIQGIQVLEVLLVVRHGGLRLRDESVGVDSTAVVGQQVEVGQHRERAHRGLVQQLGAGQLGVGVAQVFEQQREARRPGAAENGGDEKHPVAFGKRVGKKLQLRRAHQLVQHH